MMAEAPASYAEASARLPDFGMHNQDPTTLGLQDKLGLEYQLSDLNQRTDMDSLIPEMFLKLTQVVNEDDVLGLEFKPSKRFPQKCIIIFSSEEAKNKVRIRGLNIFGKNVELSNPGQGVVKVEISNASLLLPDDVIKSWIAGKVGGLSNIVQFRNEHYFVRGQKRKWVSGTRYAWVKNLTVSLPPVDKIRYGNKDIHVNIWHFNQTHMKCRFCYQIVPKGHDCPRKQERQACHKCGSIGHMQRDCPDQPKNVARCFRCHSTDHLISHCTVTVSKDGMGGHKDMPRGKVSENSSSFQPRENIIIPDLIDKALEKKKADDETKRRKKAEAEQKKEDAKTKEEEEKKTRDKEADKKKKLSDRMNQNAIDERERQHQAAMSQNMREDEERKEKAAAAAAAAEMRLSSSTLSSNELLPAARQPLKSVTSSSTSSMEVDIASSDDDSKIRRDDDQEEEKLDEDSDDSETDEDNEDPSKPADGDTLVNQSNSTEEEDDKNLDTTQFYEAFHHHQAASVALVGGSNIPVIKLVSDEDLQVQTHALWEGGAVIIQGANKISEVNPDVREKFDIIVIHLGTCNFPCKGESSVMSHFKDYQEMIQKVRKLCPCAHIVMSGLLPQSGLEREVANDQLYDFNSALKAFGDDGSDSYLHYCNNWPHFVKDGQVLDGLFKDTETFGVHVNDEGSVVLARSIMHRVKQVFYWERLGASLESPR